MNLLAVFRNLGLALMIVSFVYQSARAGFQDIQFNWPLFVTGAVVYLIFRYLEKRKSGNYRPGTK